MADTDEVRSIVGPQNIAPNPPADIDLLLDRHEETIRNLPVGEAHSHHRQRTFAVIEAEITELLKREGPIPRAMVLHARLAGYRGDWQDAVRRWDDVAEQSPEHGALAHIKRAAAHRHAGNLHAAEIAFKTAEKAGINRKSRSYAKEKAALDKELNEWTSARLISRAMAELEHSEPGNAFSLFRAAMLVNSSDKRTLAFSEAILRKLAGLVEIESVGGKLEGISTLPAYPERDAPKDIGAPDEDLQRRKSTELGLYSASRELVSRPTVLCCGFGWSGSGAVADYLREFASVSFPFGKTEVGCFEGANGADYVVRAISTGRLLTSHALARFFFVQVLGLPVGARDQRRAKRIQRRALAPLFRAQDKLNVLELALSTLVEDFCALSMRKESDHDALARLFGSFFDSIFTATAASARLTLLNNCIHAANVALVRLFSKPWAFVVVRDPRDQFAAQLLESGGELEVKHFVDFNRSQLIKVREALKTPSVARCVDVVRFEDFVASPEVRHAVLGRLGLTEADRSGERFFFAEQSQRNVGIHRGHSNQKDIARIHEELAPYMIEPTL